MADPRQGGGEGSAGPKRDRRRDARLVATGVIVALLLWFALTNLQDVEIHFWVYSTRSSLILVILIAGVLGAAVGWMVGRRRRQPSG